MRSLGNSYNRIWAANLVSTLGSQISFLAMPLLALQLSGSVNLAAGVATTSAASRLVGGLFAGVAADRLPTQVVVLACNGVGALSTGVLALLVIGGEPAGLVLLAVVALEGLAAVFFAPAEDILVRDVVDPSDLPRAYSWNEAAIWSAGLAGPVLGGVLFGVSRVLAIVANSASYGISFLLLAVPMRYREVRPTPEDRPAPSRSDYIKGFQLLRQDSLMRWVIIQVPVHNMVLTGLTLFSIVSLTHAASSASAIGIVLAA